MFLKQHSQGVGCGFLILAAASDWAVDCYCMCLFFSGSQVVGCCSSEGEWAMDCHCLSVFV
jgi:hypothetical protein